MYVHVCICMYICILRVISEYLQFCTGYIAHIYTNVFSYENNMISECSYGYCQIL